MRYLFTHVALHLTYHYFLNENMLIYAITVTKNYDKYGNWKSNHIQYWSTNQKGMIIAVIPPFKYTLPPDNKLIITDAIYEYTMKRKEQVIEQMIFDKI